MEVLITLFLLSIFVIAPIIGVVALVAALNSKQTVSKSKRTEIEVTKGLQSIDMDSYFIFENIVIASQGNTAHTEIDQVVVSPYGIFCIETKSHKGSIYGFERNREWSQYLGSHKYTFNNPFHQNYKHTRALEELLRGNLRAPIHSYVVFPNCYKLVSDNEQAINSISKLTDAISKHKLRVYDLDEYERIVKTLTYASDKSANLLELHISEVTSYVDSRVIT